jgi:hypothetical protein
MIKSSNSNTYSSFSHVEILFGFLFNQPTSLNADEIQPLVEHMSAMDIGEQVITILTNPDKAKSIVSSGFLYDDFFNRSTYVGDHEFKSYEVLQFIVDYHFDDNVDGMVFGFQFDKELNTDTLENIYQEVIIPIFNSLNLDIKPDYQIRQTKFSQTTETSTYRTQ